jgi:hypothetical protein
MAAQLGPHLQILWRDGRVVERGGLENRWARKGPGGSNPSLSATIATSDRSF